MKFFIKNFNLYYDILGFKIVFIVILFLFIGILDGFGLSMFIPLIEFFADNSNKIPEKFHFFNDFLRSYNIEFNLINCLIFMIIAFVMKGVVNFISLSYSVYLVQFFAKVIRVKTFEKIYKLSYSMYFDINSGRIQNILTTDIQFIIKNIKVFFKILECIFLLFFYVFCIYYIDLFFSFFFTLFCSLTIFIYFRINKLTKTQSKLLVANNSFFHKILIDFITNYKYLKSTATFKKFNPKIIEGIYSVENNSKKIGYLNAFSISLKEPLSIIIFCAIIFTQVYVFNNDLETVFLSLLFFYRALQNGLKLQNTINTYLSNKGSIDNLNSFFSYADKNIESKECDNFFGFKSEIKFSNVSFEYKGKNVFKNLSFKITKNSCVAIQGKTGSGKSTLMNIITGLLKINSGEITIDGASLYSYNLNSFRSKIGYINQETVIFNDTLFNNITLWDKLNKTNLNRFNKLLKDCHIYEFLRDTKKKHEFQISNFGNNLSGGQKQRIALARELYKNPEILIMDEALSALDSKTEKIIFEKIKSLIGKLTIIVISHNLNVTKYCDLTYCIHNLKVIEKRK